jgi:hypothetical protein
MRVTSICLTILLAICTIVFVYQAFVTPYLLISDFIPKTIIEDIQEQCIISAVIGFVFAALSLYFTIKRKYLITIIVFVAYLLFYFLQRLFY